MGFLRYASFATILLVTSGLAHAQEVSGRHARGPIEQDWQFSLGGFLLSTNTRVKVNGDTISGTDVNWDNEFGFDDENQFRIDAFWRFAERHKIRVMYFQNNRTATRTTDREIDFQDQIYPVNSVVTAGLDEKIIELAYEYAFYKTDKLELAGSAGIHTLKFDASLSANISTPGGPSAGTTRSSDASITGPLPVLGFRALWDMGKNFYLDGLLQFFYISFDQYDGVISDAKLAVTWMPWRNFGIGVGYNNFATRVDISKGDFDGRLKFSYGGPMLFVTAAF